MTQRTGRESQSATFCEKVDVVDLSPRIDIIFTRFNNLQFPLSNWEEDELENCLGCRVGAQLLRQQTDRSQQLWGRIWRVYSMEYHSRWHWVSYAVWGCHIISDGEFAECMRRNYVKIPKLVTSMVDAHFVLAVAEMDYHTKVSLFHRLLHIFLIAVHWHHLSF